MLLSEITTTPGVKLKIVTDKIKEQLAEGRLQAIIDSGIAEKETVAAPALEAIKPLADKFTITFSYQQQLHRTKVKVSGTAYGTPIYKIALGSKLSNASRVCWLQNTKKGWVTLLGDTLDAKLIKAITSAIQDQQ